MLAVQRALPASPTPTGLQALPRPVCPLQCPGAHTIREGPTFSRQASCSSYSNLAFHVRSPVACRSTEVSEAETESVSLTPEQSSQWDASAELLVERLGLNRDEAGA